MKKVCKVIDVTLITILFIVLALCVYLMCARSFFKNEVPKLFGFGGAIISTGSMEPAISTGDMVIIKKQSAYSVGDIITYMDTDLATFRIIEVTDTGYITQGDWHKEYPNEEITYEEIEGKVFSIIPKLGYIVDFIDSPIGISVFLICGGCLVYLGVKEKNRRKLKNAK